MSFISSFEIINIVLDSRIFQWIPLSGADAAAVHPNSINILLVKGLSAFFIIGKLVFVVVQEV